MELAGTPVQSRDPTKGVPDLGPGDCYCSERESKPGRGCGGKSTAALYTWVKDKGAGLRVGGGVELDRKW